MTKEDIIEIIRRITIEKNFAFEVSEYVKMTFLFIYDNYDYKKFNNVPLDVYIKTFLKTLQSLKSIKMVGINDLKYKEMQEFRDSSLDKNGNLITFAEVNGEFFGECAVHTCLCSGLVDKENRIIYLWQESSQEDIIRTIHHELVHLAQGLNPYFINNTWPLSFLIHVLLEEGEAVWHEEALGKYEESDKEELNDTNTTVTFETGVSYPFYGVVYKLLGLILGFDTLENLGKSDLKIDVFDLLKKSFPSNMIDTIYVNLANMVNLYNLEYPELKNYNPNYLNASILRAYNSRKQELDEILKKIFAPSTIKSSNFVAPNKELVNLVKRKEELQKSTVLDVLKNMPENGVGILDSLKNLEIMARVQIITRDKDTQEEQLQDLENVLSCVRVETRKM